MFFEGFFPFFSSPFTNNVYNHNIHNDVFESIRTQTALVAFIGRLHFEGNNTCLWLTSEAAQAQTRVDSQLSYE